MATIKVRGMLKAALLLCVLAAFWNGACSTSEPAPPHPGIQVAPAAITVNDTIGAAARGAQVVAITADGAGTLSGLRAAIDFGSGPTGWLTATLSDTTAPATLTVTPARTGLTVASYHATVVLTATAAPNSPLNVPITLDLAAAPVPTIVVTPAAVTFQDTVGTSAPPSQTVSITPNGQGTLTGLKATVDYSSGAAGWLTVSLSDTTAPATMTLRSTNTGLNASAYHATINITGTGAPNSPQAIPVTFSLAAPPPIAGVTIALTANLGKCGSDLGTESAKVVAAANPDYVFVLGANAIPGSGNVTTLQDYMNCYDPVWGKFKDKTYATIGDHEVDIDSFPPKFGSGMASGADAYFGASRVGPAGKNWQSFDLGSWHVITLNVQTPGGYKRPEQIAYHAGTAQLNWLESDLQSHHNKCTLAVWYESMWISSTHYTSTDPRHKDEYRVQDVRGVWTKLYNYNADLVINGWPRIYERFAPMRYADGYEHPTDSEWAADSARGIRQITSGLGGDGPMKADSAIVRLPTSEYRSGGNGVLKLVLGNGEYSWEFLNTKYSNIHDSGRGTCH